jgi:hypothetical protein
MKTVSKTTFLLYMNYLMVILYPSHGSIEICDFGFPQITEADTLKLYISTDYIQADKSSAELDPSKIAIQATGAVSWRRPDIKYRKNEAFIDVIESVNLIVSAKGNVIHAYLNLFRNCFEVRCIRSSNDESISVWNAGM